MKRLNRMALLIAWLLPIGAWADIEEAPLGEAVERQLPGDEQFMQWTRDPERLATQVGDELATRKIDVGAPDTVKLQNVVPPILFGPGVAEVPDSTLAELHRALERVSDKNNVQLHLIVRADPQPHSPGLAGGDGDDRERAAAVAGLLQSALALPVEAISYEWASADQPTADSSTAGGRADLLVAVEIWYDDFKDATGTLDLVVKNDFKPVKVCRMQTVCKLRYVEGRERRARVQNLVAPLHYDDASLQPTAAFVAQIQRTLETLRDKQHVVTKFIGYTDNAPLTDRDARIYGDYESLSKARARRIAAAVKGELGLSAEAVDSDGHGTDRAMASNETPQGQALNRRIEVEFWYDDSLQELPDEPQLCPADAGADTVTRVYSPPWGDLPALQLVQGAPVVPAGYLDKLRHALADVSDKTHPRLRFVGYTRNEGLDRRTALIYGDDIGLSAARARRTMEAIAGQLQLEGSQAEFEGRGFLYSDDVVNGGFIQGDTSYVKIQVVYDELAELDDYDGVAVAALTRELTPANPFALNLMRITVDGKPIDDPKRSSEDVQRCTDVAMQDADIRFGFDNLSATRRLSVAADTETVQLYTINPAVVVVSPVRFRMYSNYGHYIDRAEVRIFESSASTDATPLEVVNVGPDSYAEWRPDPKPFAGPVRELKYTLRAYGANGTFDETVPRPLWMHADATAADVYARAITPTHTLATAQGESVPHTLAAPQSPSMIASQNPSVSQSLAASQSLSIPQTLASQNLSMPQTLASYGDNSLARQNIPVHSGTVRVQGGGLAPNQSVWVAGAPAPVDASGNFVSEAILPEGIHTVEVAVLDDKGQGDLYLRDLKLEKNDWFYAGMADLTWSQNDSSKTADLFVGDDAPYDYGSSLDGRLAMYATGKFGNDWGLTTSIDTREGEVGNLFSNFLSKQPDELFRRIDPDYHYPTFGDDGTVEQLAPTEGKVYLKLNHGPSYGLWGNFNVGYMDNELAQVDRGLYGGQGHYQSDGITSFGEERLAMDLFGAEPGTIPSRQDFRGTGGSLYFLRHQDILTGSESVRIEVRDKVTGIVTGVVNLNPSVDYDIDYLQGRVVLSEPLAGTADDKLLVRAGASGGDETYLVVRYEYTPGFEEIGALSLGGQAHYWLNDYIKVGVTANDNSNADDNQSSLQAEDVTVRLSAASWVKVQSARSQGLLSQSFVSDDGGFEFQGVGDPLLANSDANAYRADVSVGMQDIFDGMQGNVTLYGQDVEAGYSAPGMETLTDTNAYGGAFDIPLTESTKIRGKSDNIAQQDRIHASAQELNVAHQLNYHWNVSGGVRYDNREDDSPLILPTQELGDRTDAVVQLGYDPHNAPWSAYGFVQDTLEKSDTRDDNNRYGLGGSYLVSERLKVNGEVSDGDIGGIGGKLGTSYLQSERTNIYLNYVLEDERIESALASTRGSEGSLVSGVRTRVSDSSSVYAEERYRHGNSLTGLTHAAGVNLAPTPQFTVSATTDIGTLRNLQTDATTDRVAGGFRVGYGFESLQLSSGVEYRDDKQERLDTSETTLKTWLYRNSFRWQMTPSSRLLGKLNFSTSQSSLGDLYNGEYTEAVLGYAYRPVSNDRLNTMLKYTYFYNVPTMGQVTLSNLAAEYVQKSHVAAIDATYDLSSRWSIGGKYAYRFGEISMYRDNTQYFDNSAALYIVRTDWRFREKWELLVEGRVLAMTDMEEQRSGALVAVSRYVGEHFKVGAGYNFTDFSDDLTDLSYDSKGFFLNLTGAL